MGCLKRKAPERPKSLVELVGLPHAEEWEASLTSTVVLFTEGSSGYPQQAGIAYRSGERAGQWSVNLWLGVPLRRNLGPVQTPVLPKIVLALKLLLGILSRDGRTIGSVAYYSYMVQGQESNSGLLILKTLTYICGCACA